MSPEVLPDTHGDTAQGPAGSSPSFRWRGFPAHITSGLTSFEAHSWVHSYSDGTRPAPPGSAATASGVTGSDTAPALAVAITPRATSAVFTSSRAHNKSLCPRLCQDSLITARRMHAHDSGPRAAGCRPRRRTRGTHVSGASRRSRIPAIPPASGSVPAGARWGSAREQVRPSRTGFDTASPFDHMFECMSCSTPPARKGSDRGRGVARRVRICAAPVRATLVA